ncbi:MAG: RnfABCDGE type electron transport complex subunit D [Wenzhouxiangella sp.]
MRFAASGAPYLPPTRRVHHLMGLVLLALLPAIAAHAWWFGWGILIQLALASLFAVGFETLMLRLRRRRLAPFLGDGSVVVTAVLFALCVPPLAPWWVSATGMLFAVVIAKHLYGGLGYNLFNPAMVGLAAVIIAFPIDFSQWLAPRGLVEAPPGLLESLHAVLTGRPPETLNWDAATSATPLDRLRTGLQDQLLIAEIRIHPVFGALAGRGWDWIGLGILAGGLYLIWQRVITWHVPTAMVVTTLAASLPVWLIAPDLHPSPLHELFAGGLLLGAFFIATDPVSGSATPRGKLLFGVGVALLTLAIRRWGGFPDGVAFAVLLMNMLVPLVDRYTRPRVYGYAR